MTYDVTKAKLIAGSSPLFKEPSQRFDFDNPQVDPDELVNKMVETMVQAKGIGLSAVQIGIPVQVFIMGHYNEPEEILPVFNPKIVDYSGEEFYTEEGCLTFPGLFIKIKRHSNIRIRFADKFGNVNTHPMDGIAARIAQHEYDHCLRAVKDMMQFLEKDIILVLYNMKKCTKSRMENVLFVKRSLLKI